MPNLRRGMMAAAAGAGAGGYVTWGMGQNVVEKNHLADGTVISRSSPVIIGGAAGGHSWRSLNYVDTGAATTNTVGLISNDYKLYMWGPSEDGSLGNSVAYSTGSSSPLQIGTLTDWASMANGSQFTIASKTDGTLWSWGSGGSGKTGHGAALNLNSPVQIGSLTDWSQTSAGGDHAGAVKTDSTLWTWGSNTRGQLGLDDIINRSSPTQVGSLTTWSKVYCGNEDTFATKTDGTLWAIGGRNHDGALGLNDIIVRSSPTQIGSATNWTSVGGRTHGASAIAGGKLYSWGTNGYGQLGIGNKTNYSVPKQVGSLTTWSKVATCAGNVIALDTAGKIWTWGEGEKGALGLGDDIDESSPVQVGSDTDWLYVGAVTRALMAQKAS